MYCSDLVNFKTLELIYFKIVFFNLYFFNSRLQLLFHVELKRSDTEDHISEDTSAGISLLMVHSDGVPGLQLHNKLSPNVVSAQAVELSRVAHRDSNKKIALQQPIYTVVVRLHTLLP